MPILFFDEKIVGERVSSRYRRNFDAYALTSAIKDEVSTSIQEIRVRERKRSDAPGT